VVRARARKERTSRSTACYVLTEVDSVLPADPAAPSSAERSSYLPGPISVQERNSGRVLIPTYTGVCGAGSVAVCRCRVAHFPAIW